MVLDAAFSRLLAPCSVLAEVPATPMVFVAPFAVRLPVTVVPVAVLTATLFAPPVIVVLVEPVIVLVAPVTTFVDEPAAPMVLAEPAIVVPIKLVAASKLFVVAVSVLVAPA